MSNVKLFLMKTCDSNPFNEMIESCGNKHNEQISNGTFALLFNDNVKMASTQTQIHSHILPTTNTRNSRNSSKLHQIAECGGSCNICRK